MNDPTLLIMAAGMGSRYGGLKQLEPLGPGGETLMEFSIHDAVRAGFSKVVFVIRKDFEKDFVKQFFPRWDSKIELELAFQELTPHLDWIPKMANRTKPWGTGHAVLSARKAISSSFAVINSDDYYGQEAFRTLGGFLKNLEQADSAGMVYFQLGKTLSPHGSVSRGVCQIDESSSRLLGIQEMSGIQFKNERLHSQSHPQAALTVNTPVSLNFWGFHPSFMSTLELGFRAFSKAYAMDPKAEFFLPTHVFNQIQKEQLKVFCFQSEDRWLGMTYQEDRDEVYRVLSKKVDEGFYQFNSESKPNE